MKRKEYEKELRKLQVELCALQDWVRHSGSRVVVIFEGRDAAGKGGTIKAITERVSPRVFQVVALPAPSDREKEQLYFQRYLSHFPTAGEIVIFDRSWYNRAGVEYVMGFCTKAQHRRFLKVCPEFELFIVDDGILLIKYWLEVSDEEQKRRFEARPPLVVGADNVPRCELGIGRLKHEVTRPRVLEPFASRTQIRGAQLPLAQRILDTGNEAALLLLVADLQPVFDEYDAVIDDEQFELRAYL